MTEVLSCQSVSVSYGDVPAVESIDLQVAAGETVALLGPSGSGKSTLLHAIAGFLELSEGTIALNGVKVSSASHMTPPEMRPIGLVFQSYALWPHLNVLDNVAYPVRRSGATKSFARAEAARLLDLVGLSSLHQRMPDQLSGGQQQRVGLARALARRADIYLFDEPTAHLDSSIRASVQEEIARRRAETGAAAIYATHDAAEALAVANRVVILRSGSVTQTGTPRDVYERPVNEWTGSLTGPVSTVLGFARDPGFIEVASSRVRAEAGDLWPTGDVVALVRADWVRPGDGIDGVVASVRFRGTHTDYAVETAAGSITSRVRGSPRLEVGESYGWVIERVWIPATADSNKRPSGQGSPRPTSA